MLVKGMASPSTGFSRLLPLEKGLLREPFHKVPGHGGRIDTATHVRVDNVTTLVNRHQGDVSALLTILIG